MPLETIGVRNPHHYWLAAREDMPWLSDPDVDDGAPRWDDRELRDWFSIGADAASIGEQLVWGMGAAGPDDESAEDDISYSAQTVNPVDAKIVRSWFRSGVEAPRADPGDEGLDNGRHRLWCAWTASPDLLLPVQSAVLQSAADMPAMDAGYAQLVRGEVERVLGQMSARVRDANGRYVAALEAAHTDAVKRSNGS